MFTVITFRGSPIFNKCGQKLECLPSSRRLPVSVVLFGIASCAGEKVCQKGGDTAWVNPANPIRGDKECTQKEDAGGRWINHGPYHQNYASGKIALEGQFVEGRRDGYWYQYDEEGNKILLKYYQDGIEMAPPLPRVTDEQPKTR